MTQLPDSDDLQSHPSHFLRFCPHCGSPSFRAVSSCEFLCGQCGFNFFPNSAAAVVAVIARPDGHIMLTRRARNPWAGMLDLPGGFVDPGESLEQALARELREELGCNVDSASYLCSFPNSYVFSGYMVKTTDAAFCCSVDAADLSSLVPHDDISEILWMKPSQVPLDQVPAVSIRNVISFVSSHWDSIFVS